MIAPINSSIPIRQETKENNVSRKNQQETEYKQPKISEKQNYQNQLADIADDMSMVVTQFSQRYGKWLDKKANRGESTLYITEDGSDKKLNKALLMFKKSGQSIQELLAYLRQMFPDESDLVMVLRELLRKKKLGAQLDAGIENEIARLLEGKNAKNIKAGINIALKAKTFAKLLALNPTVLRDLYRSYINLDIEPIFFFQMWMEEYDIKQCTIILTFLSQSLLCDMQSLMPSCAQSSEFGQLLERVNKLRELYSFIELSMSFFKNIELKNTISEKQLYQLILYGMTYPGDMNKYLISLLSGEWEKLLITIKMKLLQGIRNMFNKFPENLFLSDEFRIECQMIIQNIIDKYINIEKYHLRKSI
ncbi:type III secretion system gatekeeper subunit SctW [Proteus penneri]|uniref:type III secretion system gatekeeper subunit SctW n=1 Tax=Proteus penneri TaxID=102862 RepID=UPI000E032C71|nr:type III secretion system gatekeeper subunit SctW [Proteus penneri]SUC02850.1 type III secretion system protein [Proteus penneri]